MEQEVQAEWQGPASALLVSLAGGYSDLVIDQLLGVFKPGNVPEYFVIKTFAEIAAFSRTALVQCTSLHAIP
jgi:hypothetical protein